MQKTLAHGHCKSYQAQSARLQVASAASTPRSERPAICEHANWVLCLAHRCGNAQPEENQEKSEKYTSFGSNRSPGQPCRAREIAIQKMSRQNMPAIRDAVQVCLGPTKCRMKSYWH